MNSFYSQTRQFYRQHNKVVHSLWIALIVFALSEVIFSWLFANTVAQSRPFPWIAVWQALYIIAAWCGWVLILGRLIDYMPINSSKHRLFHLAIGLCFITAHIALMATSWFIFKAELVDKVTFGFVFKEQFFKWFYIELFIYVGVILIWSWRLTSHQSKTGDSKVRAANSSNERIKIKLNDGSFRLIEPAAIRWIESDSNYVHLYVNDSSIMYRASLSDLEQKLGNNFFRSHRSALVNLRYVERINGNHICLKNGERVPMSRRQRSLLMQLLKQA
ncbi:MAG: LytTR family transcriptional regulator [Kangiellaceae bacterium]|nr:LytTR family transcriptional regulator [Kangiellaceae bacterium]